MNKIQSIGILGAGTASAITIAIIIDVARSRNLLNKFKIDCIHDPAIPVLTVGESFSPGITNIINKVLNTDIINQLDELDGTLRYGGVNTWEEDRGNSFTIEYSKDYALNGYGGTPGMHVNSEKISKFIIGKISKKYSNVLTVIEDTVVSVENNYDGVTVNASNRKYHYDYIIDCRGMPTNEILDGGDYSFPDFETVNTVLIYPEFKKYGEVYTQSLFHKNGWMFGVPLQHRKAFGYLFNNKITGIDEAKTHFKELIPQIEIDKLRQINWRHYYRNEAMEGRVMYMGNMLYFYEPAQGLPLHYYVSLTSYFLELLISYQDNYLDISRHVNLMHTIGAKNKIQDLIALNYVGNNKMNSPFWKQVSKQCSNRLQNSEYFNFFAKNVVYKNNYTLFWTHDKDLMKQYIDGYNIDLSQFLA